MANKTNDYNKAAPTEPIFIYGRYYKQFTPPEFFVKPIVPEELPVYSINNSM